VGTAICMMGVPGGHGSRQQGDPLPSSRSHRSAPNPPPTWSNHLHRHLPLDGPSALDLNVQDGLEDAKISARTHRAVSLPLQLWFADSSCSRRVKSVKAHAIVAPMKELLTKRFWQGVRKTFHEGLEGPSPKQSDSEARMGGKPDNPSPAEAPRTSSADNVEHQGS
jgi:hypothetical protein